MKIYATITSDRGGRPAKKGGDEALTVQIDRKGESYEIRAKENSLEIVKCSLKDGIKTIFEEKGKTEKE